MTGPGPQRGWSIRRAKAAQRNEETDERAAIRAERERMKQAQIDAALAGAFEAAVLQARSRVTCPCCGGDSPLDPEMVARLITAVDYLPSHIPTNPTVRNALRAVVEGQEIDRGLIYGEKHRGMHKPRRVYAPDSVQQAGTITIRDSDSPEKVAEEVAAAVVEAMTKREPATVTPKAEPVIPSKRRPSIAELAVRGDANDQD